LDDDDDFDPDFQEWLNGLKREQEKRGIDFTALSVAADKVLQLIRMRINEFAENTIKKIPGLEASTGWHLIDVIPWDRKLYKCIRCGKDTREDWPIDACEECMGLLETHLLTATFGEHCIERSVFGTLDITEAVMDRAFNTIIKAFREKGLERDKNFEIQIARGLNGEDLVVIFVIFAFNTPEFRNNWHHVKRQLISLDKGGDFHFNEAFVVVPQTGEVVKEI
jgi:hypothetical protein